MFSRVSRAKASLMDDEIVRQTCKNFNEGWRLSKKNVQFLDSSLVRLSSTLGEKYPVAIQLELIATCSTGDEKKE